MGKHIQSEGFYFKVGEGNPKILKEEELPDWLEATEEMKNKLAEGYCVSQPTESVGYVFVNRDLAKTLLALGGDNEQIS